MPNRRLSSYDRLPPLDRELVEEWNSIVRQRVEGPDGVARLPEGSAARLAELYARCSNEKGWCVYATTASTIAVSSAHQAINDGKYSLAIGVLERLQTHPRVATMGKLVQDRQASLMASAHMMSNELDVAVKLWSEIMKPVNAKPLTIFYDLLAGCNLYMKNSPEELVEPRLLPVLGLLKSKAKKIQAIADGTKTATYTELASLLEAQRVRMLERRKAKLGKPVKHAS